MSKRNRCLNLFLALLFFAAPIACAAQAAIGVSIRIAPPALPVYTQPPCPTPGYLWTPGYWAYATSGYYWVPGVWVAPPHPGLLWTPPYWGLAGGVYAFHAGYWGPHVGFYGGINYGFGYGGIGFAGGAWAGSVFRYNTAVVNVNTTVIHDTYVNRTVINNTVVNRTSFNGPGGVAVQPNVQERMAMNEQHFQPTANQFSHQQTASQDRSQWASSNGGRPGTTAMNSVNGARFNQQGRIAQGVASGQLNARETGRLENQEARTNQEIRQDRQANGGRLSSQERQQIRQQQNRTSRHIYNQKHDAQHAPR
ncbi:YXWGXW repeat-containing protein [Silvibacterium acidisoli]|uniref:YXWGXW repeat-containing protein n=1 Tax=Acidobacteriaceae bacterium ZG23-2 TaxID=2883246 RepID=UPI00406BF9FE